MMCKTAGIKGKDASISITGASIMIEDASMTIEDASMSSRAEPVRPRRRHWRAMDAMSTS
jgi:hypothetical protein